MSPVDFKKYGGRPLESPRQQGHFLKSTGDMEPSDIQQEGKQDNDRGHGHFLKTTCDIGINKRQRHATWALVKFDTGNRDLPSRPPEMAMSPVTIRGFPTVGSQKHAGKHW